ncbi:hypothetical protein MKEN_01173400 [Mycena kentingensis (nom. inval.)]|nr:hypothetical protein MKEN_01173400 [Mycena kentingensis (nom. inval.)]
MLLSLLPLVCLGRVVAAATLTSATAPSFTTVPAAPLGSQNVPLDLLAGNTSIYGYPNLRWEDHFSGPPTRGWEDADSMCDPATGRRVRECSGDQSTAGTETIDGDEIRYYTCTGSLSVLFYGTAIYVKLFSHNTAYSIYFADDLNANEPLNSTLYNYRDLPSAPLPENCSYGWSRTNLSAALHNCRYNDHRGAHEQLECRR